MKELSPVRLRYLVRAPHVDTITFHTSTYIISIFKSSNKTHRYKHHIRAIMYMIQVCLYYLNNVSNADGFALHIYTKNRVHLMCNFLAYLKCQLPRSYSPGKCWRSIIDQLNASVTSCTRGCLSRKLPRKKGPLF
jgi:hypothetical protein